MEQSAQLELLPWDSTFLGFGTGRLVGHTLSVPALQAAMQAARRRQWKLLYWAVDPQDGVSLASAGAVGGFLADEKVTFHAPMPAILPVWQPDAHIFPIRHLTPEVLQLAQQSGAFSRFRLDPGFAAGVFERLYNQWIANAVAGADGQQVLGYTMGSAEIPVGLVTLEHKAAGAFIGLLAVEARQRGHGIGRRLIEQSCQLLAARAVPGLSVATQAANTAACAFYQGCGFREVQRHHLFHLWL